MDGPRIFLPGWGARAAAYAPGLPDGWEALQPPAFRLAGAGLDAYTRWLTDAVARRGPCVLAGHSMGGALAILLAAERPDLVERLVLISPAGLPLVKPMALSAVQFVGQTVNRRFAARHTARAVASVVWAPSAALAVARAVRSLDLTPELAQVRAAQIPATVVGCSTDTLVTARHARRIAELLGAGYRELACDGGHMWMFGRWPRFARLLAESGDATDMAGGPFAEPAGA